MNSAADELLRQGLAQLAGERPSRYLEYCDPLLRYFEMYREWLAPRDAAAAADVAALVKRHVCDCLALAEDLFAGNVIDVCSGQTVPGLPMAITHPSGRFTLLEADAERAQFLDEASRALELKYVRVVNEPAESFRPQAGFQEVVCREEVPVNEFVRRTLHLVDTDGGRWLCLKRQANQAELVLPDEANFTSATPLAFPHWQDHRYVARVDPVPVPQPLPPDYMVPAFVAAPPPAPPGVADAVPQILAAAQSALGRIERELKKIGYWTDHPPPLIERYDRGELRSYLDAPSFELWLQCVFIPRARDAIKNDALPASSDVALIAMRQYDYHSHVPRAQNLIQLLEDFDKLVEKRAQA
jgi:16S rRNA (guanine527-N7)-methyltransferase